MAADNVALTREIFERVWAGRDSSAMDQYCAGDCVFHDPLQGVLDKDEMKQLMKRFDQAFRLDDAKLTDVINAGNDIVFRFTMSATMTGPFGNQEATGRSGSATGIGIFRFEDGKLAEQWSEWNALEFMQQVGIIPRVLGPEAVSRVGGEAAQPAAPG